MGVKCIPALTLLAQHSRMVIAFITEMANYPILGGQQLWPLAGWLPAIPSAGTRVHIEDHPAHRIAGWDCPPNTLNCPIMGILVGGALLEDWNMHASIPVSWLPLKTSCEKKRCFFCCMHALALEQIHIWQFSHYIHIKLATYILR